MRQGCVHAATAVTAVADPVDVCEACILIGGEWVHLRQCLTCGRTLCCDNSPNRHMTGHFKEVGHPVMRGAGPDDDWTWCFVDDAMIREADGRWETYDPFLEMGAVFAARLLDGFCARRRQSGPGHGGRHADRLGVFQIGIDGSYNDTRFNSDQITTKSA